MLMCLVAAYCGSKAAVISMTRCDAIDYSKDNIRVNCVYVLREAYILCARHRLTYAAISSCPGVIETPMTKPKMDVLGPAISIAPMDRYG